MPKKPDEIPAEAPEVLDAEATPRPADEAFTTVTTIDTGRTRLVINNEPPADPAQPRYRVLSSALGAHPRGKVLDLADIPGGAERAAALVQRGALEEV